MGQYVVNNYNPSEMLLSIRHDDSINNRINNIAMSNNMPQELIELSNQILHLYDGMDSMEEDMYT
jgi:hypothetical protein